MPDAIITSTASTFGTISGTFAADQSTIAGTITGVVVGTLSGSVGVPGPQGPTGATGATGATGPQGVPGQGVAAGGSTGQVLQKLSATSYDTGWLTLPADFITSVSSPLAVATGNLTVDLSAYLTSATAASTYQTLAGMSSYLTSATAASTYYLQTNPSGFQTAANVTTALSPYLLSATAASTYAVIAAGQPTSGTVGQILTKNSGTNYDSSWATLIPGDRYLTTSTTSNTVSNGNKTFTIGTGLSYTSTQNITISYNAAHHMHGEVLTYNSGTGVLTVDVNHHTGSGTYSSWVVNVGGVTPATSVAWGAITGTLSSQTDLQNALDLKLAATTAASTYYLQTNPSGFIGDAPSDGSTYGRNNGAWTVAGGSPYITSVSSPLAVTSGDLTIDLSAYLMTAVADGLYYPLSGNPSGFLDASALTPYLESSTALAYFSPIASPTFTGTPSLPTGSIGVTQSPGNSTTALATTAFVTTADNLKANLASPTFTGTPTLPTGTIATTQSPGNNTTALATTAFVTAALPAFAATADINSPSSTTKVTSLDAVRRMLLHPGFQFLYLGPGQSQVALGGYFDNNLGGRWKQYDISTTSGSRSQFTFDNSASSLGLVGLVRGQGKGFKDWSKKIYMTGRVSLGTITNTQRGDSNSIARINLGGKNAFGGGDLSASVRGFGWKVAGVIGNAMQLQVSNGSTVTTVTSSFVPVSGQVFDWELYSDGTGNVTLQINDTVVATTANGPTGLQQYGLYLEGVDAIAASVSFAMESFGTKIYFSS